MSVMNLGVGEEIAKGTNILDVEVPSHLRRRFKTGIAWLDDALGGEGLVGSQVAMLTGSPGVGKSTFFLQLANSLTGQGNIVLVNGGEESVYQMKMTVERLGLKNGFFVSQYHMVKDTFAYADELMEKYPNKQLFLLQDSLQTWNDGYYKDGGVTGNTPVRCAEMLVGWCKKHPKKKFPIGLFIGQSTKGGDFSGKNTIRHAVDTHIQLYVDTNKKSETYGERLLEVTKNRFGCNGKSYILGMNRNGLYEKGYFDKTEI